MPKRIICLILLLAIPKDSPASLPQETRQTNVTDTGFTISWITTNSESGYVNFGLTKSLGQTAYDNRGQNTFSQTHYHEIRGLIPNTTYYYEIVSGSAVDNNNGAYYSIKTGPSLSYTGSNLAYGRVLLEDKKTPAEGAIVYLKLQDNDSLGSPGESFLASCLVDSNGYWSFDLINLRTQNLKELFVHSISNDNLIVFAQGGGNGQANLIVQTKNDSPAQDIILSTDTIPPATINDLAAKDIMASEITLSWTAPGDDGLIGMAVSYDIRYSTFIINDSNWLKATSVSAPPLPLAAGHHQEFAVTNLLPSTTYYLAIKTSDGKLWSGLSNVLQVTTKAKETPILSWTGRPNYLKDGLNLEEAGTETNFVYLVKYTSPSNEWPKKGEPKIFLFKSGLPLGSFSLTYVQGTPLNGIVYTYSKAFPEIGDYSYYFYAEGATGEPTNLMDGPRVKPAEAPIKVTNVTGSQFTVSWVSKKAEDSSLCYGTNPLSLTLVAYDDRGENTIDDTHHITLKGLQQNTLYYYDLVSGGVVDNNNSAHYLQRTGPDFIPNAQDTDLVYGQVYQQGHLNPAPGSIVYLELSDNDLQPTPNSSSRGSAIVTDQGYWSYDLVNLRSSDLQASFLHSKSSDLLHLFAQGGADGIANQTIDTKDDFPASDMELSIDHTAPAAIIDLMAFNPGTSTLSISWTAPGDDKSSGYASAYDLRYATFSITEANWGLATEVKFEPTPKIVGSQEGLFLTGLNPDTRYYFGLKSWDESLNISELSNLSQLSTKPILDTPPVLDWVDTFNYTSDGVHPDKGNTDVEYTFQVKYLDAEGSPPAINEPNLLVYLSGSLVGSYSMTRVSGEYQNGAVYSCSLFLTTPGTYSYQFFAASATGRATQLKEGPIVSQSPYLETNITGSQFTVAWTSKSLQNAYLEYGSTPALGKRAEDDRGAGIVDDTHSVTIRGLQPNTFYYYDLISGGIRDNNNGFHYTLKTGPELIPIGSDIVYGTTYKQGRFAYATGSIIYLQLVSAEKRSAWGSTLVDQTGQWSFDLINLRDETLDAFFKYTQNTDDVYIYANGSLDGTDTHTIKPVDGRPCPIMELSLDNLPPGRINDLQVSYVTASSTTLAWTSVGDDEQQGTAAIYEIRYSLSPIVEDNWDKAVLLTDLPAPKQAGTKQIYIITGLKSSTLYYFGIKAIDERPNTSTLSNLASTRTASYGSPILSWSDQTGYSQDGINPDEGNIMTVFTYRLVYLHPDGEPPLVGYPRVYIQRAGVQLFNQGRTMYNASGYNFRAGVTYEFRIRLPIASDYYTYYFEAKDRNGAMATGSPTFVQNGPIVTGLNYPPTLSFTNESGYTSDGVEPDLSTPSATFTFRMLYTDINGDPPASGYPRLQLSLNNQPLLTQPAGIVKGSFATGAVYSTKLMLSQPGRYQYRFEALDKNGSSATGVLSILQDGPVVSSNPVLIWPGTEAQGVYPLTGSLGSTFIYRVKYQDPDNDAPLNGYPLVHIFKEFQEIGGSPLSMEADGADFKAGVTYETKLKLMENGTYSYSFEAKDLSGLAATGSPTKIYEGPYVPSDSIRPLLTWVQGNTGVTPGTGTIITPFAYRIKYSDPQGQPPAQGFPRLFLFRGSVLLYPSGLTMNRESGNDYKQGVIYRCNLRLPVASRYYSYYFVALNKQGLLAAGSPNSLQSGPLVTGINFRPNLTWTKETGFNFDCLEPNIGTPNTTFTYQVCYKDYNGDPPGKNSPCLYVYKNNQLLAARAMTYLKGTFTIGAIFSSSITLTEPGSYQYRITAEDNQGASAVGPMLIMQNGPWVGNPPVLTWFGTQGYEADGVEPDRGTMSSPFIFKVVYEDTTNNPPAKGYPKLHILKSNQEIRGSPFVMPPTNINDLVYSDGKGYQCSQALLLRGTDYSYFFEAKNLPGSPASGSPTLIQNGPIVLGKPPTLSWTGELNYQIDGLHPEVGTEGSLFVYRVRYTDVNNLPPAQGFPQVIIQPKGTFTMLELDPEDKNYFDGKIYLYSTSLTLGTYTYLFKAMNSDGLLAAGPAALPLNGPKVSDVPMLNWVKEAGYNSDGLEPETGTSATEFVYKVEYLDSDPPAQGFPRLHIIKTDKEISGSPFVMVEANPNDKDYSDGKVYIYKKILQASGDDYSYWFEAKDNQGNAAAGEPVAERPKSPMVSDPPLLSWLGKQDYLTDGLHPELGSETTVFIYKVSYSDANNDPPATGYPLVHIFKGDAEISGSPFEMIAINPQDTTYTDGKEYQTMRVLTSIGTDYGYRFEAKDRLGVAAIGTPTIVILNGPLITHKAIISWTGETNYANDGLHPELGTRGTSFVFRVNYQSSDNKLPASDYPKLHLFLDGNPVTGSPFKMNEADTKDTTTSDGKIYTYATPLQPGKYSYSFESKDTNDLLAEGEPNNPKNGPVVSDPPVLVWANMPGYQTDGLEPATGTPQTTFVYLVKYMDVNNDLPALGFPKLHILKGNQPIPGSPFNLSFAGGDVSVGILYRLIKSDQAAGFDYRYRFEAKDVNGIEAIGLPTVLMAGPEVNTPPQLLWTGEENYLFDGLDPQGGTSKSNFTYRIKYLDADNHPPAQGYPRVHIISELGTISGSPKTMSPAEAGDTNYQDGRIYTLSIALPIGSYSYCFEAKDSQQWPAVDPSTTWRQGPFVDDAPTLSWLGESGFRTDGVDPHSGSATSSVFTYKVKYTDGNNYPPADGYPRLFILKADLPLSITGYPMTMASGTSFSQGVIYQYQVRLPFASDHYSYYFEAKNNQQIVAGGEAIKPQSGPKVGGTNFRPVLSFTDETDYHLGVKPYIAKPGTLFTFHIRYWDANGDPPASGYPLIHLYKDGQGRGSWTAQYLSGTIPKGAVYQVQITLSDLGQYQYRVEAKDSYGAIAYGFPVQLINAPIVNREPTIEWVGDTGYVTDGLEPEKGTAGVTLFTYRIKYKDADNDPPAIYYPRLYILKDDVLLPQFPYGIVMRRGVGTSSISGLIYECPITLSETKASYEYYFEAKDRYGADASGEPKTKRSGPIVSPKPAPVAELSQELTRMSLFAYPNPSPEEITIVAQSNLQNVSAEMSLEIYTLAGELVWSKNQEVTVDAQGQAKMTWTGDQSASGIYIYRVRFNYGGKALTSISKLALAR